MNTERNGQPAALQVPSPEMVAAQQAIIEQITPVIRPSVHVLVRGLLTSCPGVPPQVILSLIAYETANFMGQVFQGDLGAVIGIRNGIKQAFEDGMRAAPLLKPASGWQPDDGPREMEDMR